MIPAGEVFYIPEHQDDWKNHPKAHRALEILTFSVPSPRGPVRVQHVRIGTVMFFLPPERVVAMLKGWFTEFSLLAELERDL